jgi:hypothetical protein
MKRALAAAAALAALALPGLSAAKEPTSATIEGPGLDQPLTLSGPKDGRPSKFGRFVAAAGVPAAMFGHRTPDPMSRTQPEGTLGPRYTVTYVAPGPDGKLSRLSGELYPYAKPRPLTYMEPGQRFFETFRTHGGWFIAGPGLTRALVDLGFPNHPPGNGGDTGLRPWVIALLATAVLAGAATIGVSMVRRRRSSPAPA